VVWRAVETELDREVAVKMLRREAGSDPETFARFRSEAVITGNLQHPRLIEESLVDYDLAAALVPGNLNAHLIRLQGHLML
jgi:serine/threonine-protein kinase